MAYTTSILLFGDQIAALGGSPWNQGNPGDANFGMVLPGVDALGDPATSYRLVWFQNVNTSANEFSNGQVWRLETYTGSGDPATDPNGWVTVTGYSILTPKNDLVAGVGAGDDYIVLDAGGRFLLYDIRGDLPTTPTTLLYRGDAQNGDLATGDNDSELDFNDSYAAYQPICFCAGTLIETEQGPVPVEDLAVGDRVVTLDNALQAILWIAHRAVSLAEAVAHLEILPVRVSAGAMGVGQPARDLWLSPQHRVLVRSPIAERMTGTIEALVAVKHLCGLPGIAQHVAPREVTYILFRLARHEVVRADGFWAETLLVGPQALRSISPAARQELRFLFPGIFEIPQDAVRTILPGRVARTFAERHRKNGKVLVAG